MFSQIARIYGYFATRHADVIAAQIGFDPSQNAIDLSGARQALGLEDDVDSITHRELQRRRQVIQEKIEKEIGGPGFAAELGREAQPRADQSDMPSGRVDGDRMDPDGTGGEGGK